MEFSTSLIILIALALVFDLLNGFNDSADIAGTIISSRSMKPRVALAIAAAAGFAGPFIFGVAVAKTIGHDIVSPSYITLHVLFAALISASIWNTITSARGIPSSSSHALIGGLIGAVIISGGVGTLLPKGLVLVGITLLLSPVAGFIFGWILMKATYRLLREATPRANYFFKSGQVVTALALSSANGANDSQKTMGIITLALIITGNQTDFVVPLWVILLCAGGKSIGSMIGGWRIIRTIGTRFYKIKPIHSFTSQVTASSVIILASLFGGPVSTTQVVSMSIVGAGAGERLSKVRWLALKDILLSWVITIPLTAALAIVVYIVIGYLFY